eukprot:TRINITY_DN9567_c0_g1_i2.p1 TRINITY_DN9567_c0_g1~~TRINITY_DN9567_c0_g1_i2.p1  ORF type:complete len:424 (+),score=42.27 TRINITY_DN9567_c0_g1_i2:51-1322(+)
MMTESLVSVIIPVRNVAEYLFEALNSVIKQKHRPIELSIYEDGSTDASLRIIQEFAERLGQGNVSLRLKCWQCFDASPDEICNCTSTRQEGHNVGIGTARNRAVAQSRGSFLCMLDSDDIMMPDRISRQLAASELMPNAIIGSQVTRLPATATDRYTAWINQTTQQQLITHRFKEVTLITPTWFMPRRVFDKAGGFPPDLAEDLLFLHQHLAAFAADHGHHGDRPWIMSTSQPLRSQGEKCATGEIPEKRSKIVPEIASDWPELAALDSSAALSDISLFRIDQPLTIYRHREGSGSYRVSKELLRKIRVELFEQQVLSTLPWREGFTIWGAGKNGRQFYRTLSSENQARVRMFVDVDPKKVGTRYTDHGPTGRSFVRKIPIGSLSELQPPFVTCVSLDRTEGAFEDNLAATQAREGIDYFTFS